MKNLKLPLIIVGVILIAAIGYFVVMNKGSLSSNPTDVVNNALTGSGSVKCEYTDEEGRQITAYVKGEKMRTEIVGGTEGSMSMIYKDKTSWTWDNTKKQGMMFKAPEVTPAEGKEVTEVTPATQDSDEVKAQLEKYKESCKNQTLADSMFDPPTDVTFQDYSQMMKQQMNTVPAQYQQYLNQ